MNRELAEMVADKPAPKRVDPPLREFSPVVKRLTDIADLLAKQLAVVRDTADRLRLRLR